MREAAILYLKAAAEKSMRRSANPEAIARLPKAQELLNALPEGPERLQQELALQLSSAPLSLRPKVSLLQRWERSTRGRARFASWLARPAAVSRPMGTVGLLYRAGRAQDGAAAGRAMPGHRRRCERPGSLMLAHHAAGVTFPRSGSIPLL